MMVVEQVWVNLRARDYYSTNNDVWGIKHTYGNLGYTDDLRVQYVSFCKRPLSTTKEMTHHSL